MTDLARMLTVRKAKDHGLRGNIFARHADIQLASIGLGGSECAVNCTSLA
jgi:hypothetical protein